MNKQDLDLKDLRFREVIQTESGIVFDYINLNERQTIMSIGKLIARDRFIGLADKNGKRMYENDKVKFEINDETYIGEISMVHSRFMIFTYDKRGDDVLLDIQEENTGSNPVYETQIDCDKLKVVGNSHSFLDIPVSKEKKDKKVTEESVIKTVEQFIKDQKEVVKIDVTFTYESGNWRKGRLLIYHLNSG